MKRSTLNVFFIVGPTATGKSDIAADIAQRFDAEIVSADAFQIYHGFDLLSAKPDALTLAKVPHHLIGTMSILEEMNAAKFRTLALTAIHEIHSRGKMAIVAGGSGLYLKALTHGLDSAPSADPDLRARLNELSLADLEKKLHELDPNAVVDFKNPRRVMRAIEICVLSGKAASARRRWKTVEAAVLSGSAKGVAETATTTGVFVFRERDDLYERINRRVEKMFEDGVIEEVRAVVAAAVSGGKPMSDAASKMIGFREINELLDGKMSILQCTAAIQQATRRYAKRQLTWFRRQTNFQPLNLSGLSHVEAVERISQFAKTPGVTQGND
ncbi:MAG TPA: tRNA (adenosine(37)-N6)-dimethylallyltransferase MiaA [Chthoniobacterales bacterium]|jgi:tRNA dimethylallyltransferase|nr:tRNA (adenosine(37)-N6)-dimethylallyltransferase MiaA [Chthoniobacterales bacterium]